jgi:3-isopropylmalate/(R)-2-methylmalate dehydratase small subunit
MEPIETISGAVSVLDRANVDTDQIMPKQFLKRVQRTGFGQFLFHDWAKEPGWELPANPVLVTGENFGCGSSREHAPWGLQDYGFQAVVAPSFADIFYSNCTKIGLLPVALGEAHCEAIAKAGECQVDLRAQEVRYPDRNSDPTHPRLVAVPFEIDPEVRRRLLEGLDDIAVTLAQEQRITAYEAAHEREPLRRGALRVR